MRGQYLHANCMDTAPRMVFGFQDDNGVTELHQLVCGCEAGEASPNHNNTAL